VTPDISATAALLGEPARARMLGALMGGVALTATELSLHAGVTPSTASSHLAKLVDAKILRVVKQGRHSYFHLHDHEVASLVESLHGFAARHTPAQRNGPSDPALAAARVCYDHLAGAKGVWLAVTLHERNLLTGRDAFDLSPEGERFFRDWQIDVDALTRSRRPLCRTCLDWSERRFHLGGGLGAAILQRLFDAGWARRELDSRVVTFSAVGESAFRAHFSR
jgi:DNA-binding transcriptional ArsR family regulator